jgi:hypothetical protein
MVRHEPGQDEPSPAEFGHTMVHSAADRIRGPVEETSPRRPVRAVIIAGDVHHELGVRGGTIGRSRECDVVLTDSNVSRRHAEISPSGPNWLIQDLGSTNGVRVNGRQVEGPHPLESGDRIELGTVSVTFEVE